MRRESFAQLRASCYVWLASALERFVHAFVEELIDEINNATLSAQDLRLSLFAVGCGAELSRLQDVRGLKMWKERARMFGLVEATTPWVLDAHQKPLDARTIEPDHLVTLWAVFGLSGNTVPHPRHELALIDLSRARNDLAHGAEEPVRFGRTKTNPDVQRTIDNVEDIVLHMIMSGTAYLASEGFRR